MKVKSISALFFCVLPASVHAQHFETLISVSNIQSKTDDYFVDDTIKLSIRENSKELSNINYSYSKIGPTPACGNETVCTPTSQSVITFDIDGGGLDKPINVSYLCTTIGVYNSYHNGIRDLHCGPSYKLIWTGSEYKIDK